MIAQLDLFAAPPPPVACATVPALAREAVSPDRGTSDQATAVVARATKRAPARSRKARPEPASIVVIDEPQLPPPGAFAKINGRWHQWDASNSASSSEFGWKLCRPYYAREHLSDTPPAIDNSGKHQPKGWIKQDKSQRTVIVGGRKFTCVGAEPDPVLTEIRGIPCVVDFHYGFGTHAIDRAKPFWSPSGFRSFGDHMPANLEEAVAIVGAYIDAPRHPKGYGMGEGGCGGELMAWRATMPGGNGAFVVEDAEL